MSYWNFPRYVPVAEKKAKAEKKLAKLKKKNPGIQPVTIEGRAIAKTWWGKAWNKNLERYADYSNRIGRGRSYVRHGAVLDLKISTGKVTALVNGSASHPYRITVSIKPISTSRWKSIRSACKGKFDSLPDLIDGKFPKALGTIFTDTGSGLFPTPDEITFSCSCPDWADMCKHVAATLYGIGARLDDDPRLFFKLRNVDVNDLISGAVEDRTRELLKKADKPSARILDDSDLAGMFGIEMDDAHHPAVDDPVDRIAPRRKQRKKTETPKSKPLSSAGKRSGVRRPAAGTRQKSGKAAANPSRTAGETIERIIRRSRKGVDIPTLVKKTGFDERKIYNAIYRLKKNGRIINAARGVYKKNG